MSLVTQNTTKMAKNGQIQGNSGYVSPRDFKAYLLVRWLFSNFSMGNLIIPYEFFKGMHISCQKAKRSGPNFKKAEDMSY